MSKIKPLNGHIFIRPIKETKQVGGIDLISSVDEQDRYSKAEVVFAESIVSEGDIILYDKSNGHGYQHEQELLTVLHVGNIVGVL